MKIIIILTLISIFFGCDLNVDPLYNYKCTKEQMEKVQNETKWCIKNIKVYRESTCYESAIERNCEPRKKEDGKEIR